MVPVRRERTTLFLARSAAVLPFYSKFITYDCNVYIHILLSSDLNSVLNIKRIMFLTWLRRVLSHPGYLANLRTDSTNPFSDANVKAEGPF